MGAFTVKGIATNTVEDGVDEGVSNLVYAMGNHYFGDGAKDAKSSELVKQAFDEALEGAGQTLKFSIMNAVIYRVTEYALVKVMAGSTAIFAYIKGHRIIKHLKKEGRKKYRGNRGFKVINKGLKVLFGTQDERLKMAGMANNNINNLTTVLAQERQTATMQVSQQRKQVLSTLGLNHKAKGLNDNKKIEAYHYKMKSGTWVNNVSDKKLFLSVVPKEYVQDTFRFTQSFVDKLNSFTEYAKDSEDKLVNVAQTQVDIMTTHSLSKLN